MATGNQTFFKMNKLHVYQQARKAKDARFDGQFFIAVKSTGIFCRPICPAPFPKEQNVEYFTLAPLAMQAGYRPCLRCRPDSAPGSCAWRGVDTTVSRAITLLRGYPTLSISKICEKLGVSDRYLRDLFTRKLGIAPKKFRLSDQLLFAKHLLHYSNLSVEEIAQASGFASARRLQQNLKTGMQLTPTQIRKNKEQKTLNSKLQQSDTLSIQLAFRQPYNWPHLRDFLMVRAIEGVEQVGENYYARNFSLGSCYGYFKAFYDPSKSHFDVQLQLNDLSQLQGVIQQIRRVLDLDVDPHIVSSGLLATGLDANLIVDGIRLPGIWDPFEAGCRAILGQQISVTAAVNLVSQVAQELGQNYCQGRMFPEPKVVATSDLAFLKMPQKRREALRAFALQYAENPQQSDLNQWLSIKGIGPWTVSYAKMRGQSDPDVWLETDLVIKKQIQGLNLTPSAAEPWRSYLTFQLWSMA